VHVTSHFFIFVYPLQGYGSEKGHQQDGNAYGKQKASPAPAGSLPSCCSPFAFCFLFAAVSFLQTKLKYLARKNGGLIYICKANARSLSPPAERRGPNLNHCQVQTPRAHEYQWQSWAGTLSSLFLRSGPV